MKFVFAATAMLVSFAGAAQSQSIADQVVSQLQAEGYSRIEVKNGPSQIKVEAIKGNRELEVVYDAITGAILKQEVNAVSAGSDTRPGVQIRQEDRDFVGSRSRDDSNDDSRSSRAGSDDDDDDGRRGRDRADRDDDDDDDRGRGRGRGGRDDSDSDDDDNDDDDSDDDDSDDDDSDDDSDDD